MEGTTDFTFWSQAAVCKVEVFLKWENGGAYTEVGLRRTFYAPVDIYTNHTKVTMNHVVAGFVPGTGSKNYVLEQRVSWFDAAGAAKQCAKDTSSDLQWRIVKRKK